jgi:tetratricopeptide (TPR) repeat protein
MTCRTAVACALIVAASACASPRRNLQPVTLPDLSRLDASVQAQVRERHDRLTHAIDDRSTPVESLAAAYGEYGMVLQASEYFEAAEPAYLDAQTLSPEDPQWPYYLANLYKSRGDTDKAEAEFKRVLELQPGDLPTLIWLGRLNLDQGKTDSAEQLFQKANTLAPKTVAVVAGLGRAAIAKREYAKAAAYLEQALALDPDAESLHAPLAAAYRGLGQIDKAKPHIGQWANRDLPVSDPRQERLDLVLESGLSYELRGVRAFEVRDWKVAEQFFRHALALTNANAPLHRSLQHKLGTALALQGDAAEAEKQFQVVIDSGATGIDEATAKAHYSLALLMAGDGRAAQALTHLQAAVRYQPNYIEAHLALADFLRRSGRPEPALEEYKATLAINPRHAVARLGYAMALYDVKRYAETRDWLEQAVKDNPDRQEYKIALARVFAACPDPRVRDGKRALDISQELFKAPQHTTALGETIAMALAEYGDFAQAVAIQRDVIAAAQRSKLVEQLPRMQQNLSLYEHRQPCRTPWSNSDLILSSQQPSAPTSTF